MSSIFRSEQPRGPRFTGQSRDARPVSSASPAELIYGPCMMLVLAVLTTAVAAASSIIAVLALRHAGRSANAAEKSLTEAKRSADAAEKSAGAAAVTAEAARSEDHRSRAPLIEVSVDTMAAHNGTDAIYRVTNEGPTDLESVVIHRPVLGDVEGGISHQVARTGSGYGDSAEIGPIKMGTYERFTLSLGSGTVLPDFRVKIVTSVGEESWSTVVHLDQPRQPPPRVAFTM